VFKVNNETVNLARHVRFVPPELRSEKWETEAGNSPVIYTGEPEAV